MKDLIVQRLRDRASGSNVIFLTEPLSRSDVESLLMCSDAYLSLHRSEGLGMPPIEAMYLRKPVVATHYGGVTDFLDTETGFPVNYEIVRLEHDYRPYPAGAIWAEPDVDHAAEMMLRIAEDAAEVEKRAARGLARVTSLYGIDAAAERFAAELNRIFGRHRTGEHVSYRATDGVLLNAAAPSQMK